MELLKRIPLVDDSPRDSELALDALEQHHLANEVLARRAGAEALGDRYRRGALAAGGRGVAKAAL